MLEFLENYHSARAEETLRQTASTIANIVDGDLTDNSPYEIIRSVLHEGTNALIVENPDGAVYAIQEGINQEGIQAQILQDKAFENIYASSQPILQEMILPSQKNEDKMETYVVLAFPLKGDAALHGAVFIYQNPDAMHETSKETTKIVFISALIAFVLTTFFAFFLSSRITYPLRKMREYAFEIAKGRFDSQVPTTQNDEIGQLAVAFNQMGRQLKHHLEVINQEKSSYRVF